MSELPDSVFEQYLLKRISGDTDPKSIPLPKIDPVTAKKLRAKVAVLHEIERLMGQLPPLAEAEQIIQTDLPPQTQFAGCEIIRRLGRGSMGVAYLAYQEKLKRQVVIKILHPVTSQAPAARERFIREGQLIGQIDHPNVVPVYEAGEENGLYYIIMKYMKGVLLSDLVELVIRRENLGLRLDTLLHRIAPNPEEREKIQRKLQVRNVTELICTLMQQICDGVVYAHEHGVVHRDIKPGNIVITDEGVPVLFDFGLGLDLFDKRITQTGEFIGTPLYCAPEQFRSKPTRQPQLLDVYSLGVTLYEAVSGGIPYLGDKLSTYYANVTRKEPQKPSAWWKSIPYDLEIIIMKAIAKDVYYRYPSVKELRDDLTRFLNREPIQARPPNMNYRVRKWVRRHPWPLATGLVAVLAVVGVLGVQWWQEELQIRELKAEATSFAARADLDEAAKRLEYALNIRFDDADTWARLGRLQFVIGRYAAAITSLREAIALHVDEEIRPVLASAYLHRGQLDDAREVLAATLRDKPKSRRALDRMALVELVSDRPEQARAYYERLRSLQASGFVPYDLQLGYQDPAVLQLALMAKEAGDHAAAQKYLAEAVRLEPDNTRYRKLADRWAEEGGTEQVAARAGTPVKIDGHPIRLVIPFGWEPSFIELVRREGNLQLFRGPPGEADDVHKAPRIAVQEFAADVDPVLQAHIFFDRKVAKYEGGTYAREIRPLSDDPHHRFEIEVDIAMPTGRLHGKGRIVESEGHTYIVFGHTPQESYHLYDDDIDAVLDSISYEETSSDKSGGALSGP